MSEKKIRDSIDQIEPADGAKERMYRNILQKAAAQSAAKAADAAVAQPIERPAAQKKKPFFRARYALPIAACFCLLIVAAVQLLPGRMPEMPGGDDVQGGNPFAEVDSDADFAAIGITLAAPAGAENAQYAIIDGEIADLRFSVKGERYTVRASAQDGDFSGLHGSKEVIETVDAAHSAVLSAVLAGGVRYYEVTWTDGGVYYCLYGAAGADSAQIRSVYAALIQ